MGFKFIKRTAFIDYTPTCSPAANVDFPITNVKVYDALLRPYHSADTTNDVWITLDKGAATTSIGTLIDDINFNQFYHYSGTTSNTTSNEAVVFNSIDERTQRYRYFIDATHSNRYIRIKIPAGTGTTDGTDYFRIGRIIIGSSHIELLRNIFYPYTYTAPKKYAVLEFESGSEEVVNLGSQKIFQCEFGISAASYSDIAQWWSLDSNDEDQLLVMYENAGDPTKAYVVQRKGSINVQEISNNIYSFSAYVLKEKI